MQNCKKRYGRCVPVQVELLSADPAVVLYLQDVRYVIHTITFCAVFGTEKVHFSSKQLYFYFENCGFLKNKNFKVF